MVEKEEAILQCSPVSRCPSHHGSRVFLPIPVTRGTGTIPAPAPAPRPPGGISRVTGSARRYFDLVPTRMPNRCHVIARVLQSPDPDKADALPAGYDKMEREIVSRFKRKNQQPPCLCLFLCLPDRNDRPGPTGHAVSRCVQVPAGVPDPNGRWYRFIMLYASRVGRHLFCILLPVSELVI